MQPRETSSGFLVLKTVDRLRDIRRDQNGSMKSVLIAYGTTEGHTRLIATRIQEWCTAEGWQADLFDTSADSGKVAVSGRDAYVLAGSLHQGKHQATLIHFVNENLQQLNATPTLFLSASLCSVIKDERHRAEAQGCIDGFLQETGLKPTLSRPVEGALLYTKYDFLKRFLLKMISKSEGGATDTSQDYEYTDWGALQLAVKDFLAGIPSH